MCQHHCFGKTSSAGSVLNIDSIIDIQRCRYFIEFILWCFCSCRNQCLPSGKTAISLGDPNIPDEVIVFALALARHHKFASRSSVDFTELENIGLTNYLCLPPTKFRERLKKIALSERWKKSFSYTDNANLDSITFESSFTKDNSLISLLQSGTDTWI